jgi:LmbE family N-acetylglucosaminyl deacetylase
MMMTEGLSAFGIITTSRILVVMPHPDDEAIFCAGLLHLLSANGIPTRVITMSAGEKSPLHYGVKPSDDLGKIREQELARALTILGITDSHMYHYPDGELKTIGETIQKIIRSNIEDFCPTHVVTLEPNGIYGHPDHKALSEFTKRAVSLPIRLLYVTVSPSYHLPGKPIKPILPDIELRLRFSDVTVKIKALRAHNSQFMGPVGTVLKSFAFFVINHMTVNEFFAWGN